MSSTALKERVQVLLEPDARKRYEELAKREGLSLSAWLRKAGQERAERQRSAGAIQTSDDLDAFFDKCAAQEAGEEPDWEDHKRSIQRARRDGLPET